MPPHLCLFSYPISISQFLLTCLLILINRGCFIVNLEPDSQKTIILASGYYWVTSVHYPGLISNNFQPIKQIAEAFSIFPALTMCLNGKRKECDRNWWIRSIFLPHGNGLGTRRVGNGDSNSISLFMNQILPKLEFEGKRQAHFTLLSFPFFLSPPRYYPHTLLVLLYSYMLAQASTSTSKFSNYNTFSLILLNSTNLQFMLKRNYNPWFTLDSPHFKNIAHSLST